MTRQPTCDARSVLLELHGEAGWLERLRARRHLLRCRSCRTRQSTYEAASTLFGSIFLVDGPVPTLTKPAPLLTRPLRVSLRGALLAGVLLAAGAYAAWNLSNGGGSSCAPSESKSYPAAAPSDCQ